MCTKREGDDLSIEQFTKMPHAKRKANILCKLLPLKLKS